MNCSEVRSIIMTGEGIDDSDVARHLADCQACRELRDVQRLMLESELPELEPPDHCDAVVMGVASAGRTAAPFRRLVVVGRWVRPLLAAAAVLVAALVIDRFPGSRTEPGGNETGRGRVNAGVRAGDETTQVVTARAVIDDDILVLEAELAALDLGVLETVATASDGSGEQTDEGMGSVDGAIELLELSIDAMLEREQPAEGTPQEGESSTSAPTVGPGGAWS